MLETTDNGFQRALDYIRDVSDSRFEQGKLFERMMKVFFQEDPIYKERFSKVWLWDEWASEQGGTRGDLGIDLVAEEREGGYCAIQCKCYSDTTAIQKRHIDSFIAESNRTPYTSRIIVDTGKKWGVNALKAIEGLNPECQVIHHSDLAHSQFQWPDLSRQKPEELKRQAPYTLREHQTEAFDDVIRGFEESDRGKLIMACGTGKTFTALRIAEKLAGLGGSVLYLVPSISLLSQTMREWAEQKSIPHRYIGICSDRHAGRTDEDASMQELEIPVTTNLTDIMASLHRTSNDKMTVVFCTYQSLPKIENAQNPNLQDPDSLLTPKQLSMSKVAPFDLIICDEAHRTTGVDKPGDKTSPFILVHDKERIHAKKRLYMTATARLYTEGVKAKAARVARGIFSMDDEDIYGPEFHHLTFYKAVDNDLLSDFKVVILAVSEGYTTPNTGTPLDIPISRATQIFGCWKALQDPEKWSTLQNSKDDSFQKETKPLTRAIAFTRTIKTSEEISKNWNKIIDDTLQRLPDDEMSLTKFRCETKHVDGKTHAFERKNRIEWLKGDNDDNDAVCRILSNAKCLSEGIDVPALDAVLFIDEKKSVIEIVQAVGRVMRKTPEKKYGYVVLPIAIPEDADINYVLDNTDRFSTAWSVLRALRSHDERFNAEINRIDMNTAPSDRIIFGRVAPDDDGRVWQLSLFDQETLAKVIYPKIVEKCGDREYWETWAKDVAAIFKTLVASLKKLLDNPENEFLREWFSSFHAELRKVTNNTITRDNAIEMVAQHIITYPVFDALFENYNFSQYNPVARALNELVTNFAEFGFKEETKGLRDFYESVRLRASGIDNSKGRQRVLMELYQKFFVTALKKESKKLGIAYTPVALIDFILQSVDEILQKEFNCCLSDKGVNILDPFIGTGTSMVRLLESGLIRPEDLVRKYREELYASEILLLAYYIAAVNIEEAFRLRCKDYTYEPFDGIILADTFNLNKEREPSLFEELWMKRNNERVEVQQQIGMKVVVSNPPWSAGQKDASDNNQNVVYPELRESIKETYVAHSTMRNKNNLYNTYKQAIRWASDRIEEEGIIAYVTPASWIDGLADAGVRACLAKEFTSIYVLNLRGDARGSRNNNSEGEVVFENNATRQPVAIMFLIKNPDAKHEECNIQYREIGDNLKREEKLKALNEARSIYGFNDWQTIIPDKHNDWINQRSEEYEKFYPLGTDGAKAGKADDAIFNLYSSGVKTGRDSYSYNFSRDVCEQNGLRMTRNYLSALSELEATLRETPKLTLEAKVAEIASHHASNLKWDRELRNHLKRKKETKFSEDHIRKAMYRPFVATNCYANYTFIQMKYQMDRIFPESDSENRVICVPSVGNKKPFSVLMTDIVPDLGFISACQCFPRWRYEIVDSGYERRDNISDTALRDFRKHYRDQTITKDAIFNYVYGILHASSYRKQFANDLSKELPRIPFAPNFHTFAEAGERLAKLHLNYETGEEYEDIKVHTVTPNLFSQSFLKMPENYQLRPKAMRFEGQQKLYINDKVYIDGIPEAAHSYIVNDRTPLEWFIDRYKIVEDKGIVNDPNDWFENARDIVTAIKRIVYVSVETTKILEALPSVVMPRS